MTAPISGPWLSPKIVVIRLFPKVFFMRFLPYEKIGDSFRKIIIVKDIPTHYNESGIFLLNLFDFLKNSDSLNR